MSGIPACSSRQGVSGVKMGKLLEIKNLSIQFRHGQTIVKAVEGVHLDIYENEILALAGESGSGKTTLLNLLTGFMEPSQGEVLYYSKVTHEPKNMHDNLHKIKKYIGAYLAVLNGAALLVFSATIGERSAIMRSRICAELENLGIVLDDGKNNETISMVGFIGKDESPVKIAVITTDEMSQVARETAAIVK